MPEARALHQDATLTGLSVKYTNDEYIWDQVMPPVKVSKRSDSYFIYNKEDSFRMADDSIGPKSLPNEVDWGVSSDNYSVKDHALSDWVPQETIDNADAPLSPLVDTNDILNAQLSNIQEKRVADIVFAAANYGSNTIDLTNVGANRNWGESADTPIADLMTAIEACFKRANTLVFGVEAWLTFRALPEVLDAVKSSTRYQGSPGGLATLSEVAGLLEVPKILVGRARYNTSKQGQTASYSRIWGKDVAALYVAQNPGIKTLTFGVSFQESPRATYTDFDGKRGVKGAHFVKVAYNSDEKIIATDVGYLIKNAIV